MNSDERRELETLVFAHLNSECDGNQRCRLNEMLRHSESCRRMYLEYTDLQRRLAVYPDQSDSLPAGDERTALDDEIVFHFAQTAFDDAFPTRPRSTRKWALSLSTVAALLVVVAGIYWWSLPASNPIVAEVPVIVEVTGQVELVAPDGAIRQVKGGDDVLQMGHEVRATGDGSRFRVRYEDGTFVECGPATTLAIPFHESGVGKQLYVKTGAALVDVAPQPTHQPLLITTPHASTRVLGTRFQVSSRPQSTVVNLFEGRVRVKRKADGETLELIENNTVEINKSSDPLVARRLPRLAKPSQAIVNAGVIAGMSPDGSLLVTTDMRGLRIWNIADGSQVHTLSRIPGFDARTAFTSTRQDHVLVYANGHLSLWDLTAGQHKSLLELAAQRGADISEGGKCIGVAETPLRVHVFSWDTASETLKRRATFEPLKPVRGIAVSEVGSRVALGSWPGGIHIYNGDTGERLTDFDRTGYGYTYAIDISTDGRLVAAAWANSSLVEVFDLVTGKSWTAEAGVQRVNELCFSADGKTIAAGCEDGTAYVWSTKDGSLVAMLDQTPQRIQRIALSRDGSMLATTRDHSAVLWDTPNRDDGRTEQQVLEKQR